MHKANKGFNMEHMRERVGYSGDIEKGKVYPEPSLLPDVSLSQLSSDVSSTESNNIADLLCIWNLEFWKEEDRIGFKNLDFLLGVKVNYLR